MSIEVSSLLTWSTRALTPDFTPAVSWATVMLEVVTVAPGGGLSEPTALADTVRLTPGTMSVKVLVEEVATMP